ncbi:hypothetical protein FGO68_gene6971 [Halteria grandinella]|uniref:Uncharacterized protein n=1 Tax=Halteria grandinella TaxID=5974 RepID=A0A8J8SX43_HALGN|nr:hypothetical protein FGO68_gene6971 [Halteria grandinella]
MEGKQPDQPSTADAIQQFDLLFKFIIIGDTSVGKSCILHHYLRHKFNSNSRHTVGVEFGQRFIQVVCGGLPKTLKLQIWDTAGQERYRSVTRSYFRGSLGVILVYDVTSLDSFNHVQQWLTEARQFSRQEATFMIVGNKKDLVSQRVVEMTEGAKFALENECLFMECSALSGENIEEVFNKTAHSIIYKVDSGEIAEDLIVNARNIAGKNTDSNKVLRDAMKNPEDSQGANGMCQC